ncbi:coiled-coil domain-containing protein 80-like [Hypanus sabinus]|uniref:coiled-coil domain-containing protein 80-like n=1 Tax=Hypanus sabinus TaxID=79690 RepID=UPI0028C4B724|nr:coiled-coil domain-containing protein 80-like [Hypanus sabinus]
MGWDFSHRTLLVSRGSECGAVRMAAPHRPLAACVLLLSLLRLASGDGSQSPTDHKSPPTPGAHHGPLARHFGKARLLVIAAPGPRDTSYRLMERQVDLKNRALRCELALRDLLFLVLFQGSRPARGKLLRVSQEGKVLEERLRPEVVKQISQRLSLEPSRFGMVLLRKSLQVYERFPYAVRMQAVLETVDQMPLRKVESLTRRAQKQKCIGFRARKPSLQAPAGRNLANGTSPTGTLPNRSVANSTSPSGSLPNRSVANGTSPLGSLPNRSVANGTSPLGSLPNRSVANGTSPLGSLPNRSVANGTSPLGSFPNRSVANGTSPLGSFPNRSVANGTSPSGSLPNRSVANGTSPTGTVRIRTVPRGSQSNARLRPGLPSSRKHFRSPNGRYPEPPRTPAVGRRRQKALSSERGAARARKAKSPRNPAGPGQETVKQLLGQIEKKVMLMKMAKARHPLQTAPNTDGTPTAAPLPDSQPPAPAVQRPDGGSPEEFTALAFNPDTAGSHYGQRQVTEDPILRTTSWSPLPEHSSPPERRPTPASSPKRSQAGRGQSEPPPDRVSTPGERNGGRPPPTARAKAEKVKGRDRENSGKGSRGKGRKNRRNRKNKKGSRGSKRGGSQHFLEQFRNKRRLLVITAPSINSRLYIQQRDEYLEHVCQLALRRISVIIILGSLSNSTLTVEHYQTENEKALDDPMTGPVSEEVITELRKDFGMTFDEFFMVLVDYNMKVKQYFDVPIPIKVLVNYMDTFPSRLPEIEQEKKSGVTCLKHEGQVNINKFLFRLQRKRRLLIISAPDEEEWMFQQQMSAVTGQDCHLGIRHFALLKLTGTGEDTSGMLELFPPNGRSQVEKEKLSSLVVNGLREHFQVSEEHFMMLLVSKDGTVLSWSLSPVWSLATIYELVDSMQLRQEEVQVQESLGINCQDHTTEA